MATAEAALGWMRERIGIGEDPPGSNHNSITDFFGLGPVPWCAESVSLALNNAWGNQERWQVPGVKPDYLLGFAYVPNLRGAFIDAGLYDTTPRVGDVVIFSWGPGVPIGDHTGLVEQVLGDGTVVTLEGNTGDDLLRKRRSMAVIDGFGHPPYDAAPTPRPPGSTPQPPPEEDDDMSDNTLFNHGGGVILRFGNGALLTLANDDQVGSELAIKAPSLGDVTDEQYATLLRGDRTPPGPPA